MLIAFFILLKSIIFLYFICFMIFILLVHLFWRLWVSAHKRSAKRGCPYSKKSRGKPHYLITNKLYPSCFLINGNKRRNDSLSVLSKRMLNLIQWEWCSVVPKFSFYQSNTVVVKLEYFFGLLRIRLIVEKSTASQSISY